MMVLTMLADAGRDGVDGDRSSSSATVLARDLNDPVGYESVSQKTKRVRHRARSVLIVDGADTRRRAKASPQHYDPAVDTSDARLVPCEVSPRPRSPGFSSIISPDGHPWCTTVRTTLQHTASRRQNDSLSGAPLPPEHRSQHRNSQHSSAVRTTFSDHRQPECWMIFRRAQRGRSQDHHQVVAATTNIRPSTT